ncbi:hypothetical protein BDV36DRAFT_27039 [Aspergillus pseudocaelatus]|uniref:Secreted protein n=1 Tax=Aspergillus pseudocaelatus TaxID=1825620 RepID=A0ABQ6W929_9EURO|nr:hypothetical protein BDV36DRAFT_27039 [Aspergillus pseudocaelatus]
MRTGMLSCVVLGYVPCRISNVCKFWGNRASCMRIVACRCSLMLLVSFRKAVKHDLSSFVPFVLYLYVHVKT